MSDNTKVGFVGRKVAGKSTLIGVLLGKESLDSGEVIHQPHLSFSNVNLLIS
jgi:ATPase subunit of ABC transporter with duplicated ATPase domains